jgi:hypothetical protein
MKQARFIQLLEVQKALYALDEEGRVWRYAEDSDAREDVWMPLSSKRLEEPSAEPGRPVGFLNERRKP